MPKRACLPGRNPEMHKVARSYFDPFAAKQLSQLNLTEMQIKFAALVCHTAHRPTEPCLIKLGRCSQ